MNPKDIKIGLLVKWVAVATIVFLLISHTSIWKIISAGISPVLSAFVFAYILDYIVRFFEKKLKVPRSLSILITMTIVIITLILLGVVIVPGVLNAVASLINAIGKVDFNLEYLKNFDFDNFYLNEIQQALIDTVTPILQKLTNATGTAILMIVSEIQKITSGVISIIVSFVISIYMLGEKKDLVARIKRMAYAYFTDEKTDQIFYTFKLANKIFKAFFLGKLLDSTIIGILAYLIFRIFNFEYALLIALIIGITNMIPYFGPFIGAVPAGIITFVANPSHPVSVLWMLLIILIIQQLDGLVIGPFILGDSVGVNAFWIILAVTVGGATFGLLGMFLGVPVSVLVKTLIEEDVERKLAFKGYNDMETTALRIKKK
ncbi:MAG: AI-2E family transporter [Clostridia bacterium]|nr:AI-2E family transporter [Clostridia bacterium]